MAGIGGFAVTTWRGRLHRATRIVSKVEPLAGVNGNVIVRSAWRSREQTIVTSVEVNGGEAVARDLCNRYRALIGTIVTAVDQFGEGWTVTVMNVEADKSATFIANRYRVVASWLLLPSTDQPT